MLWWGMGSEGRRPKLTLGTSGQDRNTGAERKFNIWVIKISWEKVLILNCFNATVWLQANNKHPAYLSVCRPTCMLIISGQCICHASTLGLLLQSSPECSVIGTWAVPVGCLGLLLKLCFTTFYIVFIQRSLINHIHECVCIIHVHLDKSKKNTTN